MRAILLFAASAVILTAQVIPGHYLVELNTEPVAVTAVAGNGRLGAEELRARGSQIQAERVAAEAAIQTLGGTVTHRFDRLVNGMAV
ncbi:MAG TPA: hypothetical protein VFO27_16065, partial [Bryobacteraceae bacterium]|nr:hypothetical protein [Bryobacteraceae bacterium]